MIANPRLNLKSLILTNNMISEKSAFKLCEALEKNKTLTYLGLGNNFLTVPVGQQLIDSLKINETLKKLDIEFNSVPIKM